MGLCDDVRRECAAVAAQARSVRIDLDALGALEPADPPELDPASHYLEGSEADVATYLAGAMACLDDRGLYKRAQITANDLALAGIARYADLDRLTIFADNLVPHVLRCDGVLVYDEALATHIDDGSFLGMGREERE